MASCTNEQVIHVSVCASVTRSLQAACRGGCRPWLPRDHRMMTPGPSGRWKRSLGGGEQGLRASLSFSVSSPLRGVKQAASPIISLEDRGAGWFHKHGLPWAGDTETQFFKTTPVVATCGGLSTRLAPHRVLYTPLRRLKEDSGSGARGGRSQAPR